MPLGSALLAVAGLDVVRVVAIVVMFGLIFVLPVLVFVSGIRMHRRLAQEPGERHLTRRGRPVSVNGMTRRGWAAIVLAGSWAAWSIAKLASMTILQIASLTDPAAGLDPVPDADLTLFQRDGAWAIVWLVLPAVAVLVVAALRKRGASVMVGTALVPVTIFTGVLAFEALPIAVLLTLAGFIGPKPTVLARRSNIAAVPLALDRDG